MSWTRADIFRRMSADEWRLYLGTFGPEAVPVEFRRLLARFSVMRAVERERWEAAKDRAFELPRQRRKKIA